MAETQRLLVDFTGGADEVPFLIEDAAGDPLPLPEGATRNADGTVTLTLAYPVTLTFRLPGGPEVQQKSFAELVLRRLTGLDMRRVIGARGGRSAQVALARSADLSEARIALLYAKMDASDISAANAVVASLCGFDTEEGLPASAVTGDDGAITLPLSAPVEPQGFAPRHDLVFRRLRGDDLIAISQSKDLLPTAMARATGLSPKEANAVFDAMDAADIMAMQRVVGFLSGSGRRIGG
jgi:hypothetical protein